MKNVIYLLFAVSTIFWLDRIFLVRKFQMIILFTSFILLSCMGKSTNEAGNDNIPGNIVPFEYDGKDKAILLNGTINDSIQLRLFFDTGTSFNNPKTILLSDSIFFMIYQNNSYI